MQHHLTRWASVATLGLMAAGAAWTAPISSSLVISASVALDTADSTAPSGGATQTGSFTGVSGGSTSSAGFDGLVFTTGSSPLTSNLTDLNDGIGARLTVGGNSTGGVATAGLVGLDYALSLQNSSATETFIVTFQALIANAVAASGSDAYAQSKFSLFDAANMELVFSDHRIDTFNTGPGNNFLLDSASNGFAITLAPGSSASFTATQDQIGGVYAAGAFSADLDAFLRITSVTSSGGPTNPVPLPGTLPLVALGLAALAAARRRRPGA